MEGVFGLAGNWPRALPQSAPSRGALPPQTLGDATLHQDGWRDAVRPLAQLTPGFLGGPWDARAPSAMLAVPAFPFRTLGDATLHQDGWREGSGGSSITVPVSIPNGGTGVTSVTTTPTATAWAGWDSNKNLSANALIPGYTITSGNSTVTLTVSSTQQQVFTGGSSSGPTINLPLTSTLVLGQRFELWFISVLAGFTVKTNSGTVVAQNTLIPETLVVVLVCVSTAGSGAASEWTCANMPAVNSNSADQGYWYNPGTGTDQGQWKKIATADLPAAHACNVQQITSAQSIGTSSWTSITFNSNNYDTDSYHNTVTNNTRITIPSGLGGKYLLTGLTLWAASGAGTARFMRILKNGTTLIADAQFAPPVSGQNTGNIQSIVVALVATDYVELQVWQDTGGNLSLSLGSASPSFTATYIGA